MNQGDGRANIDVVFGCSQTHCAHLKTRVLLPFFFSGCKEIFKRIGKRLPVSDTYCHKQEEFHNALFSSLFSFVADFQSSIPCQEKL
jgi:hypothetical protein